ncbi:Methylated-DNA--protein-cysteine methyltransferase (EC 2.1.1.63) [uncultured Gammaproteobacteria bacterium]|nr:Methylated-DNA--protein-cysteine methyltransferase (EC [Bathymodiolus brooksi thiotrophic gill symbiont]CAC9549231.1 Methylated-DNA--protein-cysteine methyltransferase (EC 2.1.1.63) [uncultured Gammaproteobacteria bacterium]CAC9553624.1 Methylated-DNA--protein-cysteine methyltransferase (EC 2.1.1.63) [uncultured Gammaproteobacteria bacterium]CAC9604664.1 Methylated-DNA--protein-cysteine methyltransferase (EC 2.1.1.63) [uncultured Gammaproteobacteria bacterium]CAC9613867.1 Methylated-DNA--pro
MQTQVGEYLDGRRKKFDLDLHMVGTDFQQQVWRMLLKIPYGKIWRYKYEAEILGKPNAVRAVANANGCNKISLIVPCHRVIATDGSLSGYGGGLDRKRFLLDLEKK